MQKARVANPGPAGLLVINPRGRKMATKRRRKSTARPSTARRKSTTTKRRSNPTVFSSARKRVTRSRRSVARRRNPSTGMFAEAGTEALILVGLGLLSPLLPPIGGASPLAAAARQAGLGYLVGEVMQRFNFGRGYGRSVKKIGLLMGGVTLVNAYLAPMAQGFLRPRPVAPQVDANGNALAGIAPIYRGMQPFRMYANNNGMNGIALIDPAQQPYGEYAS